MDKTTKLLLAAIAMGLWANAGVQVIKPSLAQFDALTDAAREKIYRDMFHNAMQTISTNLEVISEGTCQNVKLCTGTRR